MRIGFDFDNTIVNYDQIFHKVASEKNLIQSEIPINKLAVRNYLRSQSQEDIWTEMQGYVYGARMQEAISYAGVFNAMQRMQEAGHTLYIVSHKTQYPYLGQQYDLHAAARLWIKTNLCVNNVPLIPAEQIFFELTKDQKISRIGQLDCDIFMDDLPEILLDDNFPNATQRYLFDPEQHYQAKNLSKIATVSSWMAFESSIL